MFGDNIGVVVCKVEDGLLVDQFGFVKGDIIVFVNGIVIEDMKMLVQMVNSDLNIWCVEINCGGQCIW